MKRRFLEARQAIFRDQRLNRVEFYLVNMVPELTVACKEN